MFKKITALLLLMAILVNLTGYFVIYQVDRLLLRHEMSGLIKAGAISGGLEKITLFKGHDDSTLEFTHEHDEFCFHGILYDVVSCVISNDSISYTCVRDNNEQSLISSYTMFIRQHSGLRDTGKEKPILALVLHLLTQAIIQKIPPSATLSVNDFIFPALCYRISDGSPPDIFPPPETC